jgi:hypothetical protein
MNKKDCDSEKHWLGSVCGHMHACVDLGWGTRLDVWVGNGRVSWIHEDVGLFDGR